MSDIQQGGNFAGCFAVLRYFLSCLFHKYLFVKDLISCRCNGNPSKTFGKIPLQNLFCKTIPY